MYGVLNKLSEYSYCYISKNITSYTFVVVFRIVESLQCILKVKVSEYPFKPNKNVLKNMAVLLYTYFYNISLNALRPTFFNIYNLPFLRSSNIGKIRVKVGPKTNYFYLLYELLHQQN